LYFRLIGHTIYVEGTDIEMKLSFVVALLVAAGLATYAQTAMPRMTSCDPQNGKKGDVIAVTGENLEKEQVAKLFLTDGKNDIPVVITEQSTTTIKFKIPEKATGRMALMVLTAGKETKDQKYIEQPVKVTIDE
jgi:nitrous oxidase accessory protein NosD